MGRPPKLTPEIVSYIETVSLLDAKLTNPHLAKMIHERWPEVTVSESRVSEKRTELGFRWRPALVKQDLSIVQQFQRFQFAQDLQQSDVDQSRIVFSDESRFVLGDDNRWRHLRRGEWNHTAFATRQKFPISVMIWGAIGVGFKSGCTVCSQGVDAGEYQQILKDSGFIDRMNARCGVGNWWFMQDGAPCHTAKATMELLRPLCLILPGWPPNSPDLNPIEIIWAIMKRRVKELQPQTEEALKAVISRVWDELDQGMLDRLILGFMRRVAMVVKVNGRSISQYLSSHRSEPIAEDAAANPDFRRFGADEDAEILRLVQAIGNRWKRISEILASQFPARDRGQVKHRAKFLMDRMANDEMRARCQPPAPHLEEAPFNPEAFFGDTSDPFRLE
jgi:hypothetical protein